MVSGIQDILRRHACIDGRSDHVKRTDESRKGVFLDRGRNGPFTDRVLQSQKTSFRRREVIEPESLQYLFGYFFLNFGLFFDCTPTTVVVPVRKDGYG